MKTYPNGKPMFNAAGMMLDENGNRSIFGDVDVEFDPPKAVEPKEFKFNILRKKRKVEKH